MSDDLTNFERRLTLAALWNFKYSVVKDIDEQAEDDDDRLRLQETGETCDEAARKLGGDPTKNMYGAPEF